MNLALLGGLAKTFALISIISVGGATATLPEIHRQIVETQHLMDDGAFANAVAVAQIAPGPNVMIIGMIGWQLAGGAGLIVAMLGMLLPSCILAFTAHRLMRRFSAVKIVSAARQALAPIAVGLILASGFVLSRASARDALTIAITAGMTLFVARTKANPLFGIVLASVIGAIERPLAAMMSHLI
jgi:chromate transporter